MFRARVFTAGISASIRVLVRRLRHGPTHPTWTWSEELLVAIFRASLLSASAADIDLMSPRGRGPKPPLARAVGRALTVEDVDLAGVRAERYCPKAPRSGTMLRFHGGGFVTGTVATERRPSAELAVASGCETFSIEYRLAPKHPYPAALEDAITAYRALIERGADPASTIFFGASAGAGLALSALLKCRELGLPQPAGAVLLWPYADFTFSGASINTFAEIDMLPLRDLAGVWGPVYVGGADPADPLVSPALADLSGLPPLLVIAGGAESLLSCAERIDANARTAGVDCQFTVYPHKVHGWMMLPKLPATLEAVDEINKWVAARLADARFDQ
jgi:acetyl esterase/lipase